jgi:hypothetical protein
MAEEQPDDGTDTLGDMIGQISTPKDLAALLDAPGVDDAVINQFVTTVGTDRVLDRLFTLMGTRFLPEKAGADAGVVEWTIQTDDGPRVYHVTISGGRAEGARGPAPRARTTLRLNTPNLMRLCSGKLNGVTAVITGKIKLGGDLMFAARMQGYFDY